MPQFHLKQGMHKAFQSEFCSCIFFIFVKFADWQQENHLISISGPSSRLDLNTLTVSWLMYDWDWFEFLFCGLYRWWKKNKVVCRYIWFPSQLCHSSQNPNTYFDLVCNLTWVTSDLEDLLWEEEQLSVPTAQFAGLCLRPFVLLPSLKHQSTAFISVTWRTMSPHWQFCLANIVSIFSLSKSREVIYTNYYGKSCHDKTQNWLTTSFFPGTPHLHSPN